MTLVSLYEVVAISKQPKEEQRRIKESMILEAARAVFCRKGFLNVTMKDIIDECEISRGGIYLYFSSVDEIFQAVSAGRDKAKFAVIRRAIDENVPFDSVLEDYLLLQKERLLNMENSLLRATYEYLFSLTGGASQEFRKAKLEYLRNSVAAIFQLGINQGAIRDEGISLLVDHFILVVEGLGVLALTEVITQTIVEEQFFVLTSMLDKLRM